MPLDLVNYSIKLNDLTRSEKFLSLPKDEQQKIIADYRQATISENPNVDIGTLDKVTEAENVNFLRTTGQGRILPNLQEFTLPTQSKDWESLSEDDKLTRINEWRNQIPDLAATKPTQKGDTEFGLNQVADEIERRIKGQDTGYIHDKLSRIGEGAVAGFLNYTGFDGAAKEARRWFSENPEYDDSLVSGVASGLGDAAASMAVWAASVAVSEGLGATATTAQTVATLTSLVSNGMIRYKDAYSQAIEKGLDDAMASDAGIAAMPAAVIDVLGDKIIAGHVVPHGAEKAFRIGTDAEKRYILSSVFKNASTRNKVMAIAKDAIGEGLTEAGGDFVAGYGAYLQTQDESFIPDAKSLEQSFAIGAILGGGIASAHEAPKFIGYKGSVEIDGEEKQYGNKDQFRIGETFKKLDQIPDNQDVYQLLANGDYKGAMELSNSKLSELETQQAERDAFEREQAKVAAEAATKEQATEVTTPEININSEVDSTNKAEDFVPSEDKTADINKIKSFAHSIDLNDATRANQSSLLDWSKNIQDEDLANRQAHGADISQIAAVLDGGIDPERVFHSGPAKYADSGTGAVDVRAHGITQAMIVGKTDAPIKSVSDIDHIVVNDNLAPFVDQLKAIYPDYTWKTTTGIEGSIEKKTNVNSPVDLDFTTPSRVATSLQSFGVEGNGNSPHVRAVANWFKKGGMEEVRKQAQDRVNAFSSIEGKESQAQLKTWEKVLSSLPAPSVSPVIETTPIKSKTLQAAEKKKTDAEAPIKSKAAKIVPTLYLHKFDPFEGSQDIKSFEDYLKGRFTPTVDLALDQMFLDLKQYNPKLKFEFANEMSAAGGYLPKANKIILAPRQPNLLTVFHEVAHALTYSEIDKLGLTKKRDLVSTAQKGGIKVKETAKQNGRYSDELKSKELPSHIQELVDVYLHSANDAGIDVNENIDEQAFADKHGIDNYGFYDLAEFVSEAFSNSVFQERLSEIDYNGRSVWQRIVDSVRTFLEWMNIVSPADLVMRNDGNNALRETLTSIRQLIGTSYEVEVPATIEEANKVVAQEIQKEIKQEAEKLNVKEEKPLSKSEEIKRINQKNFEQSKQAVLDAINDLPNEGPLRFKKAKLLVDLKKAENIQDCADILESASILYRPSQQEDVARTASYARLDKLIKGKIDDKIDQNSVGLLKLVRQFKRSDISKMSDENQSIFFGITDNIYNARKKGIENPSQRYDNTVATETLVDLKRLADASAINEMVSMFDGLIDFDKLNINLDDRVALEKTINNYLDENGIDPNSARSEAMQKRQDKINEGFRKEADEIKTYLTTRYADASNFVDEYEAVQGTITSKTLRDFVKLHYNYLLSSNLEELEGNNLYKHFFGLNNLSDLVVTHIEPTISFISSQKDSEQRINEYAGMFRDPMLRGKIKGGIDKLNQLAELKQVQLARASAYPEAQRFLQEDLLGDLFHSILQEGTNRSLNIKESWVAEKESILKKYGKEALSPEDRHLIAIMGRLIQHNVGEDADKALKRNILKERQSIKNIIRWSPDDNTVRTFKTKIESLFERMVDNADSMDQFVSSMESRLAGSDGNGAMRVELLKAMQNAFSGFTSESRIISEAFHGKQFNEVVNYIPGEVSNKSTKENSSEYELDDISSMLGVNQKAGLTTKIAYYNPRSEKLGETEYYSYNPEFSIDRAVDIISYDHESMLPRMVLKERLKKGSLLNQVISGGEEENPVRVSHIRNVALSVIQNAVTRGEPAGLVTDAMRVLTKIYAVPKLSSLHHIISQPASTLLDYGVRTGRWNEWMQAALFYATNKTKVDEFFSKNSKWTAGRGALEALSLDRRRSPGDESTVWESPLAKKLGLVYDKAQSILTTSLRIGDDFSAKATVLAEYFNQLKKKGYKYTSVDQIDLSNIEGFAMTQAVLNSERSINTSNKILRGDLHQDRDIKLSAIRNILMAFSGHSNSLATQLNQAVRDLYDLKTSGAPTSSIKNKINIIAAITLQSVSFTSIRYGMLGLLGMGMTNLIKDLFDDDEGKIAKLQKELYIAQKKGDPVRIQEAENELALAKSVRKQIAKFESSNLSSDSWFKQVSRDVAGQIFYPMNLGVSQSVVYWPADFVAESIYKDTHQTKIAQLKNNIKEAKEHRDFDSAARMEEELTNIQGIEYIPFAYQNIGGVDMGGIYGGAIENVFKQFQKAVKQGVGVEEFNMNDLFIYSAAAGIGQSDFSKFIGVIDRVEQEQFKAKAKAQGKIEEAKIRKKEKEDKETDRLISSLLK